MEKAQDRLDVLEKIEKYELEGKFDVDPEIDPPAKELLPNQVDYLHKKLSSKIKSWYAYKAAGKFMFKMIDQKQLIIKDLIGIENLQNLKSGAVLTCNHFNPFDSFLAQYVYMKSKQKKKKFYRVIKEGNYTSVGGFYGLLMKNCNTLPLSSNRKTMALFLNAVNTVLKRGDFVLIYPEQALWWNYRKPRPLKPGGFKFAVSADVPVVPIFITMEDSDVMGADGFPIQQHTIHISKPIYPDENLSSKENIEKMKNENYKVWVDIYEKFYGEPLKFTTKEK